LGGVGENGWKLLRSSHLEIAAFKDVDNRSHMENQRKKYDTEIQLNIMWYAKPFPTTCWCLKTTTRPPNTLPLTEQNKCHSLVPDTSSLPSLSRNWPPFLKTCNGGITTEDGNNLLFFVERFWPHYFRRNFRLSRVKASQTSAVTSKSEPHHFFAICVPHWSINSG
jgi:hypothetical protein